MSRAGYSDGDDNPDYPLALWRGAVASSIRGKRGQALLKELVAALDALPEKRLIAHELVSDGGVSALGAVARARGQDVSWIDPASYDVVAKQFNIAEPLAREIEYENDECALWNFQETPEHRWARMRAWALLHIEGSSNDGEGK
jgi:hypothetical protein